MPAERLLVVPGALSRCMDLRLFTGLHSRRRRRRRRPRLNIPGFLFCFSILHVLFRMPRNSRRGQRTCVNVRSERECYSYSIGEGKIKKKGQKAGGRQGRKNETESEQKSQKEKKRDRRSWDCTALNAETEAKESKRTTKARNDNLQSTSTGQPSMRFASPL